MRIFNPELKKIKMTDESVTITNRLRPEGYFLSKFIPAFIITIMVTDSSVEFYPPINSRETQGWTATFVLF